jgi:hypothetical protein
LDVYAMEIMLKDRNIYLIGQLLVC